MTIMFYRRSILYIAAAQIQAFRLNSLYCLDFLQFKTLLMFIKNAPPLAALNGRKGQFLLTLFKSFVKLKVLSMTLVFDVVTFICGHIQCQHFK